MIRLKRNPTFRFTASFTEPGAAEPVEVTFIGKHQGQEALMAYARKADELLAKVQENVGSVIDHVVQVLDGWADVLGDDGQPAPFTPAAARELLDSLPGSAAIVLRAYIAAIDAARRKN